MQVIFHLDSKNRDADLEYYTTDVRDKHNQIKPVDNIVSMTPDSLVCDGNLRNFLAPIDYFSIDRLYLGVSMPLFANVWGAAFLRELLKLIKADGSIIMPVYPEGQAVTQGYWCRSALEDAFRSRRRWHGQSNINAENDGVMSMRVGRKWPRVFPSTARWLMQVPARIVMNEVAEGQLLTEAIPTRFNQLTKPAWQVGTAAAICQAIVKDYFGSKKAYAVCDWDDGGALGTEFALSADFDASLVDIITDDVKTGQQIRQFHQSDYRCPVEFRPQPQADIYDVALVCGGSGDVKRRVGQAWNSLRQDGILIAWAGSHDFNESDLDGALEPLKPVSFYYSYVATSIKETEIVTNYSGVIHSLMQKQKDDKCDAFRVIKKT